MVFLVVHILQSMETHQAHYHVSENFSSNKIIFVFFSYLATIDGSTKIQSMITIISKHSDKQCLDFYVI
jgi:hypothetical protein